MKRLLTLSGPRIALLRAGELITVSSDLVVTVLKQQEQNTWRFLANIRVLPQGGSARMPRAGEVEAHFEFNWGFTNWSTLNPPGVIQVGTNGVAMMDIPEDELRFGAGMMFNAWGDPKVRMVAKHKESGAILAQEVILYAGPKRAEVGGLIVVNQGNEMPQTWS